MRTHYLDPDFRRTPKTNQFCAICQKDIKEAGLKKAVKIYLNDGCFSAVHPDDIGELKVKVITGIVGAECKKNIPAEFIIL
jgi:hypothetical protein